MSSWIPPERRDGGSSHDPGVKGKEVVDERGFSEALTELDWVDFVVIGVAAAIPTSFLTMILLWEFFPGFRDTAGDIVRVVLEWLPLVVRRLPELSTGGLW
jgi:hypothetical protein